VKDRQGRKAPVLVAPNNPWPVVTLSASLPEISEGNQVKPAVAVAYP